MRDLTSASGKSIAQRRERAIGLAWHRWFERFSDKELAEILDRPFFPNEDGADDRLSAPRSGSR
jgi:hypothetical protein